MCLLSLEKPKNLQKKVDFYVVVGASIQGVK